MIMWMLMIWQHSVRLPKLEPEKKKKKVRRWGGRQRVGDEEERQKVSQLPPLRFLTADWKTCTAQTANH